MKYNKGIRFSVFLLLSYLLIFNCSFNPDADTKSASGNNKLMTIPKATKRVEKVSGKNANLVFSDAKCISKITGVYEGNLVLNEDLSRFTPLYEDFFKKRLSRQGKIYKKENVCVSDKYVPQGYDYMDDNNMLFTMTAGGFIFDYKKDEEIWCDDQIAKVIDLNKEISKNDLYQMREFDSFLKDTGYDFVVKYIPYSKTIFINGKGKKNTEYEYKASYKGGIFDEVAINNGRLNADAVPLSGQIKSIDSGKEIGLQQGAIDFEIQKKYDKVISIQNAANILSNAISDHKEYKVTSYGLVYLQTSENATTKNEKGYKIRKIHFKPYWGFYISKKLNREIVGFVDVKSGEVIFVNKSM